MQVILFVADQRLSRDFYLELLGLEPVTDVPGMTEFELPGIRLGLMPEVGIHRIIGSSAPHPSTGNGIPRCELYLRCPDVKSAFEKAVAIGAIPVSAAAVRDWGDTVAYALDPDGHVLAFAAKT